MASPNLAKTTKKPTNETTQKPPVLDVLFWDRFHDAVAALNGYGELLGAKKKTDPLCLLVQPHLDRLNELERDLEKYYEALQAWREKQ